jgi:hypothetical protein
MSDLPDHRDREWILVKRLVAIVGVTALLCGVVGGNPNVTEWMLAEYVSHVAPDANDEELNQLSFYWSGLVGSLVGCCAMAAGALAVGGWLVHRRRVV